MEQEIDVRAIRATLEMTQAQLAKAVGVDQSTVSNWERGMQPNGSARILLAALLEKPRPSSEQREAAQ